MTDKELADALERKDAEIARLRKLLCEADSLTEGLDDDSFLEPEHRACMVQWRDDAREALADTESSDESA